MVLSSPWAFLENRCEVIVHSQEELPLAQPQLVICYLWTKPGWLLPTVGADPKSCKAFMKLTCSHYKLAKIAFGKGSVVVGRFTNMIFFTVIHMQLLIPCENITDLNITLLPQKERGFNKKNGGWGCFEPQYTVMSWYKTDILVLSK